MAVPALNPEPAKTASRADPALRRAAPARRPASYGGAWQNRPLYDRAASSGSVVDGDPLNLTDPSGLATLQLGGAGSVNIPLGPIGISIPLGVGIAVDTGGHVGVYGYWGGGVQIGAEAEAEAGLSIQVSNAQTICDLGGPFANFSGHAGLGFGGSADFFSGSSQHGPVYGGGVTLGAAAGASLSAAVTNTTVKPIW
jgi:hypothetical protein